MDEIEGSAPTSWRGFIEQWIKEGKHAIKWTRLSCTTFRANAVRLQLHALAYNLANFLRTLALPGEVERWSLTSLREKVVKIGAKVIAHGRYAIFQMAEVAVRASCSAASSIESRGCARQTRPHADARGVQRRAAGGRAAPGVRPRGAAVSPEGPWRRPGPARRASQPCSPSPRGQKPLAFEVGRAVSEFGDGDGLRPSGECPLNPFSTFA